MPTSKKPRKNTKKNKSAAGRVKPTPPFTVDFMGETTLPSDVIEGMGLMARGGEAGRIPIAGATEETVLFSAQCTHCRVRTKTRQRGFITEVGYEPKATSDHCVHGLKNMPKALHCPHMKAAYDAVSHEFYSGVAAATRPSE